MWDDIFLNYFRGSKPLPAYYKHSKLFINSLELFTTTTTKLPQKYFNFENENFNFILLFNIFPATANM